MATTFKKPIPHEPGAGSSLPIPFILLFFGAFVFFVGKFNNTSPEQVKRDNTPITSISLKPRETIINYVVQPGDDLESIAKRYNISQDTIIWANDLDSSTVEPGTKLTILPMNGVMHIVQEGEAVDSIAKKYKVDSQQITNFPFNHYKNSQTFELETGQMLLVPNGQK